MSGVLLQKSPEGDEVYLSVDDVFGELGVLLGTPLPDTVTVFSSNAVVLQLDLRFGSAAASALQKPLLARLFRFVASVCLGRVELQQERARRVALASKVVRERVSSRRNEFDETMTVVDDDAQQQQEQQEQQQEQQHRTPKSRTKRRGGGGSRRGSGLIKQASATEHVRPSLKLDLTTSSPLGTSSPELFSMLTAKQQPSEKE